jgi:hypothetical protein
MEPRSPAAHRTKDFAALQTKTPAIAAGAAFESAAKDGRFVILAIGDDGNNPSWMAAS